MKDRLLFNGVHIQADRTTVDKGVKLSLPVLSHAAKSPFRRGDEASMVAKETSNLSILERSVQHGLLHIFVPISGQDMSSLK